MNSCNCAACRRGAKRAIANGYTEPTLTEKITRLERTLAGCEVFTESGGRYAAPPYHYDSDLKIGDSVEINLFRIRKMMTETLGAPCPECLRTPHNPRCKNANHGMPYALLLMTMNFMKQSRN